MGRDSFKKFRIQIEQLSDPLREHRVQMEEMRRLVDPLREHRVQMKEMRRLVDPLREHRVQMKEMRRLVDPLREHRVQMKEMRRLVDPLREHRVQMEEMRRLVDPLREHRVQMEEMRRLVDPLREHRVQMEEMRRLVDPLREHRVQIAQASNPFKNLHVRLVDPIKELCLRMVEMNKPVVNFDRILDEIVGLNATHVSTLTSAVGIDVFIEPKHPGVIEQPDIIPRSDDFVPSASKRVFIVCGADEGAKQAVARWIEKLGLEAIIIDEQPSGAQTRIEKLEKYTDNVDFTVVLLTPDDLGKPKDKLGEPNFRASQDVIFRLGVLIGKYGRDRICFLCKCKGELELPSDINGINFVRMDTNGGWILNLIREMEAVGLSIDLHKAI